MSQTETKRVRVQVTQCTIERPIFCVREFTRTITFDAKGQRVRPDPTPRAVRLVRLGVGDVQE
jgi:hypothetical protein